MARGKDRIWSDGTDEVGNPEVANGTYTTAFRADSAVEAKRLAAMLNLAEIALDVDFMSPHYGCGNSRPCVHCDFDEAQEIAKRL